jgi:hypothetical protein
MSIMGTFGEAIFDERHQPNKATKEREAEVQ